MKKILFVLIIFCFTLILPAESAEQIVMRDGKTIYGQLIEETPHDITLNTRQFGQIAIEKDLIAMRNGSKKRVYKKVKKKSKEEVVQEELAKWERNISLGYTQTTGNTEKSQFNGDIKIKRKTSKDEWDARYSSFITRSDEKTDAKKFNGMLRYAFSFGKDKKWYNFYKVEGDQDRFANINWRVIPSSGVGYWFSDTDDFKFMVEAAGGYEITDFRDNTEREKQALLVPRYKMSKKIFDRLTLSRDMTFFPSLEDLENFRYHSETELVSPLTDKLSWKLSYIEDFNANPKSETTKKGDYRFVTSLDYKF